MTKLIPIAITILEIDSSYLFIKRQKPPYENLWSLVGGKVNLGEHIRHAAIREVMEETGASNVIDYEYRGFVSERLVDKESKLVSHFLIFVGHAEIDEFHPNHSEGRLSAFSRSDIEKLSNQFLPSDLYMFNEFISPQKTSEAYECELVQNNGYYLSYFRGHQQ